MISQAHNLTNLAFYRWANAVRGLQMQNDWIEVQFQECACFPSHSSICLSISLLSFSSYLLIVSLSGSTTVVPFVTEGEPGIAGEVYFSRTSKVVPTWDHIIWVWAPVAGSRIWGPLTWSLGCESVSEPQSCALPIPLPHPQHSETHCCARNRITIAYMSKPFITLWSD